MLLVASDSCVARLAISFELEFDDFTVLIGALLKFRLSQVIFVFILPRASFVLNVLDLGITRSCLGVSSAQKTQPMPPPAKKPWLSWIRLAARR